MSGATSRGSPSRPPSFHAARRYGRGPQWAQAFADAYGVGTWIAGGPVIDFSLDIVEVEGVARSKRGKLSGRKQLWRCPGCGSHGVAPRDAPVVACPTCTSDVATPVRTWVERGQLVRPLPSPADVRALALREAVTASGSLG